MIGIGEGHILGIWKGTGIAESLKEIPLVPAGGNKVITPTPTQVTTSVVLPIVATVITPRGPTPVAVFVMEQEAGAQVRYEWRSDVTSSYSGVETRRALELVPRERYSFTTYLDDDAIRVLLSGLVIKQAQASAYGVALETEALYVVSVSSNTVTVPTTTLSDWAEQGQRAIIIAADNATALVATVLLVTATTIVLDATPVGAVTLAGSRIMPLMPCYLDDTATLGLYPTNAGSYDLSARASYFGNSTGAWTSAGATIPTYTDPVTSKVYPVYDVPLPVEDTSPRAAVGGTMTTDFGGAFQIKGRQYNVDFMRQILHIIRTDADRQYLKAFMGAVLGRTKAFMLPTWKQDLLPASASAAGGSLLVFGKSGANDYAGQWFSSPAQKHLMLWLADGTYAYVAVTDVLDNLNGTQTVQIDRTIAQSVIAVSFLETCRLDTDSVVVQYEQNMLGRAIIPVRTVRQ